MIWSCLEKKKLQLIVEIQYFYILKIKKVNFQIYLEFVKYILKVVYGFLIQNSHYFSNEEKI